MTHQPPLPAAATSPYPLHPEPVYHSLDTLRPAATAPANSKTTSSRKVIQLGTAIGIGSAAIVAALLYARRNDSGPSDDKSKRGKSDRSRIASGQPYEVAYFARKHGLTAAEAGAVIAKAGPSRDAADALAKRHARG